MTTRTDLRIHEHLTAAVGNVEIPIKILHPWLSYVHEMQLTCQQFVYQYYLKKGMADVFNHNRNESQLFLKVQIEFSAMQFLHV